MFFIGTKNKAFAKDYNTGDTMQRFLLQFQLKH